MSEDHKNVDTVKKVHNIQEHSDSDFQSFSIPVKYEYIIMTSDLDKPTHLPSGIEKMISNDLGKDWHYPSEKEGNYILTSQDGATSVNCFGNEEIDRSQSHLEDNNFTVYWTRFWILALFSYISFVMILVWATFSPILFSAEYAFGWDDGNIALLEGLGSVFSLSFMIPFSWMTQKYGLRIGMLTVCCLISVATGLRCITTNQKAFTYLANAGAIINGAASCLLLSLPPLLSVQWFPMKERATATAMCTIATQLGIAGMYFAPLVVRTPVDREPSENEIRSDIHTLMLIYFGMAFSALVCAVVYFPAKPPTPPSASSSVERVDYFKSIKMLLSNRDVMIVCLIYTFSLSIPFCWITVMNLSLQCLGISQSESMWIAITASVSSSIVTFTVARLTDRFHGYMKRSIAVLLIGSACFFFWFLLMTEGVIVVSKAQLFIAIIFAMSLQYSTVPLLIEFAVELAYPCPEIAVGTLLSLLLDISDASFMLLLMINSTCYHWLSYALVAATLLTIIPLLFVNEVYKRSALDINQSSDTSTRSTRHISSELKQNYGTTDTPVLESISMPD